MKTIFYALTIMSCTIFMYSATALDVSHDSDQAQDQVEALIPMTISDNNGTYTVEYASNSFTYHEPDPNTPDTAIPAEEPYTNEYIAFPIR